MANLQKERLGIAAPPFTNTGVDYFGPITVNIFRKTVKRWGCLYTCLTTRAIHLEVAESLETDAFINALERFSNRRGYPSTLRSTVELTSRVLRKNLGKNCRNSITTKFKNMPVVISSSGYSTHLNRHTWVVPGND